MLVFDIGGHYVAFLRLDGGWFRMSDSWVTLVDEAAVLKALSVSTRHASRRTDILTPRPRGQLALQGAIQESFASCAQSHETPLKRKDLQFSPYEDLPNRST